MVPKGQLMKLWLYLNARQIEMLQMPRKERRTLPKGWSRQLLLFPQLDRMKILEGLGERGERCIRTVYIRTYV